MNSRLKSIFQVLLTVIFIFQAYQAFQKYFKYPVVTQTSIEKIEKGTKTDFQICEHASLFDYHTANRLGYSAYYLFLVGMSRESEFPTWRGINGNLSYEILQDILIDNDFANVSVNEETAKSFIFHNKYCLETQLSSGKDLKISTTNKSLKIFLNHKSTDLRITNFRTSQLMIDLEVEETAFHYWRYSLKYEVYDDTIHDGNTCVDYRRLKESYGDCIYNIFKQYAYLTYGCYPPWLNEGVGNVCEKDSIPFKIENGRYETFIDVMDSLTDGDTVKLMKQCPSPCYKVKVELVFKAHYVNIRNFSYVLISNEQENVTVYKSAYSYDLFALVTELGSSLGLWLGNLFKFELNILLQQKFKVVNNPPLLVVLDMLNLIYNFEKHFQDCLLSVSMNLVPFFGKNFCILSVI